MWPLGLGAMLLGGLLGHKQNPTLSPALLNQYFGTNALSDKTNQLYSMLVNSPVMSQMMQQAALQGASLRNNMAASLGQSGLSAAPMGQFLTAAGRGYGAALQRQGKQALYNNALDQAGQLNQQQMAAFVNSFLQRQGQPTFGRMVGSSLFGAGAQGLLSAGGLNLGSLLQSLGLKGSGGTTNLGQLGFSGQV